MTQIDDRYLGHLKYYGNLVDEGFLDTRKSAQALLGFDEILRYFIYQEDKTLNEIEFEIPVKIQKGSWMAIIPENIEDWLKLVIGTGLTTYAVTAAKKMAENDFKEIGLKTIFKAAFKNIIWVIFEKSLSGQFTYRSICFFSTHNTSPSVFTIPISSLLFPNLTFSIFFHNH